jgi:cytochrome b561
MLSAAAAMTGEEAARYTRVAIALHWIVAALLIGNIALGLTYDSFGKAWTPWTMFFHKSIGLSVLALSLARLAWRLGHRPPPYDAVLKGWERRLAGALHWLFYVMMIAIPLTGWLLSSSSNRPTDFFGLLTIPPLPISRSDDAHDLFEDLHEYLGKAMIGLILLHVAGALKHHFGGHRHLIGRMAPWAYRSR